MPFRVPSSTRCRSLHGSASRSSSCQFMQRSPSCTKAMRETCTYHKNVLAPHGHHFAPFITRTNRKDCRVHVDAAAVLVCGFPGGELSKLLWCPEPPWCEWPIKVCRGTAASASTVLAKVLAHAAPNLRTIHELLNDHPKVLLEEAKIGSAQVQDIQCA